jgi:NADPH:quinone reductase-like Zn-dependent oxidoreductase
MRALQISAYGNPSEVLRIAEIPEAGAPGAGEVLIEIELAPLNKHDFLFMRGYFGGPVAPTVVGNEGYSHVAAVGPNVKSVEVGDRVLAPNLSLTWRERLLAPAEALFPLPGGDRLQLAQLASNPPTAALILSEYIDLKPGDWIVQNGANSGVGRSLIALAKKRGFRTINLVRRLELIDEIKQAGGDIRFRCGGRSGGRQGSSPSGGRLRRGQRDGHVDSTAIRSRRACYVCLRHWSAARDGRASADREASDG